MYTPRNLKKWTLPAYYMGAEWPETYVFLGRNRDSDNLDNSNFETALTRLGGESETVQVICENHWVCGWVEWIGINEADETALALADDMKESLADYPLLDEEDYSRREYDDFWNNCQQAVKDYCNDHDLEYSEDIANHVAENSNEMNSDTWPSGNEIKEAIAQ